MSRFDQFRTEQIRTERQFFNKRNCFQHDAKTENLENLVCGRLSLVISFVISSQIRTFGWLLCSLHRLHSPRRRGDAFFKTLLPSKFEAK